MPWSINVRGTSKNLTLLRFGKTQGTARAAGQKSWFLKLVGIGMLYGVEKDSEQPKQAISIRSYACKNGTEYARFGVSATMRSTGELHWALTSDVFHHCHREVNRMNKTTGLISLGLAALALVARPGVAEAAPTLVATISGAYDVCEYDTPCLEFHNTTNFDFTSAQMVLTGYGAGTLNNGLSQTVNLPNLVANVDTDVNWGTSGSAGQFYIYDYDDSYGFQATCPFPDPINAGLCAQIGNFKVTFTALWDGHSIYSVFSPTTNASGGFVGWEGVDPNGWSENPLYDVHTGSLTGVLANIYEGTVPVPEPSALGMFGLGTLMLGLFVGLRRRLS